MSEWWAIKYKAGPKSKWIGPTLVEIEGDTLYWDGGPAHMTIHPDTEIEHVKHYVNEHRYKSDDWWDRVDEIRNQFEFDFPPEAKLKVSGGWLAPDGKFYPCGYMQHIGEAYSLALVHYNSDDGDKTLEEKGWAKICDDGTIFLLIRIRSFGEDGKYTQAQINTLGDLLVLAKQEDDERYAKKISRELQIIADKE